MPYYHACVIVHDCDERVAYELAELFGKFIVKAVGFEERPKPHFHILFRASERIDYRSFRVNGVYIRFIRVKSRRHYFNLVRYIRDHEKWIGGGGMKKEEFVRFVVESLKELREKVGKLEEEIANLKSVQKTDDTTLKTDVVEVNLSRMNVRLQPARKGVAMRIRFARYIKPNNKGEYYVILTEKDVAQLVQALNSVKIPKQENEENTVGDGKSVNIVKGFDKAVKE